MMNMQTDKSKTEGLAAVASSELLERRLQALQPLLAEVSRRAEKENVDWWKPNSGEAFEVCIDQEMWEQIKDAL